MKTSKISTNLMLMATVVAVLNFNSCKKYEDGPGFSLKTKKGRLTGEWEIVKIIDNDDGSIVNLPYSDGDYSYSMEMEFVKDGKFSYTYSYTYLGATEVYSYSGNWEFSSNKEELEVELDGDKEKLKILRLTSKELWFEDQNNSEWHLEAK